MPLQALFEARALSPPRHQGGSTEPVGRRKALDRRMWVKMYIGEGQRTAERGRKAREALWAVRAGIRVACEPRATLRSHICTAWKLQTGVAACACPVLLSSRRTRGTMRLIMKNMLIVNISHAHSEYAIQLWMVKI